MYKLCIGLYSGEIRHSKPPRSLNNGKIRIKIGSSLIGSYTKTSLYDVIIFEMFVIYNIKIKSVLKFQLHIIGMKAKVLPIPLF